jgi:hypothetical protein
VQKVFWRLDMPKVTVRKFIKALLPHGLLYIWKKYNHQIQFLFNNKRLKKCIDEIRVIENSVLLIEVTQNHGEVLPGLAKYLLDLGYRVDVVRALPAKNRADSFSRFQDVRLRIFQWQPKYMQPFLCSKKAEEYKHIIINSFYDYEFRNVDLFKLKPVCMIHNSHEALNNYGRTNKIISLVRMDCFDREQPVVVNSHYFGDFIPHGKSRITEFIAFGSTEGGRRRNINLIMKICEHLASKNIKEYRIKIVGGSNFAVSDKYSENIQYMGSLDFFELYKEIELTDFILALIDPSSVEYTNKASSTYQLCYGFLKPVLIHKKFADAGNFNGENSILYESICQAVEQAIDMSTAEYDAMVGHLRVLEQTIYKSSFNNLKHILEADIEKL